VLDGFLLDKMLRQKLEQRAPKSLTIKTSGNLLIFAVWIKVAVSKISSKVPNPPGKPMKAYEFLLLR
jgi:hypothetical protein